MTRGVLPPGVYELSSFTHIKSIYNYESQDLKSRRLRELKLRDTNTKLL